MQISKLFPVVCAVVFSASLITARADDNSAQPAANAGSEQKTNELNGQPIQPPPVEITPSGGAVQEQTNQSQQMEIPPTAATGQSNEPTITPAATPETNTAPIAPPPLVKNQPATIIITTTTKTEIKAPAEMVAPVSTENRPATTITIITTTETNAPVAKMVAPASAENPPATQAPATPETTTTTDIVAPTPAPPAETVVPASTENPPAVPESGVAPVQTSESAMSEVQPAPAKPEKKAKKHKKVKAPKKAKTPETAKAPQTAEASQTNAVPNIVKEPVMQPIVAPPLPISTDKQTQLNALLEKYKANAITAGEYQTERAEILAEP